MDLDCFEFGMDLDCFGFVRILGGLRYIEMDLSLGKSLYCIGKIMDVRTGDYI